MYCLIITYCKIFKCNVQVYMWGLNLSNHLTPVYSGLKRTLGPKKLPYIQYTLYSIGQRQELYPHNTTNLTTCRAHAAARS